MRVDIARALCLEQPLIVFDELTSVVDREIAKVSACDEQGYSPDPEEVYCGNLPL